MHLKRIDVSYQHYKPVSKPAEVSKVLSNYPNPFNPETVIKYSMKDDGNVNIIIYNVLGQKVKTLVISYKNSGSYEVKWDGKNNYGDKVSSGIYFYRLILDGKILDTKKMLMLK